jgi:hypothetical protein
MICSDQTYTSKMTINIIIGYQSGSRIFYQNKEKIK